MQSGGMYLVDGVLTRSTTPDSDPKAAGPISTRAPRDLSGQVGHWGAIFTRYFLIFKRCQNPTNGLNYTKPQHWIARKH